MKIKPYLFFSIMLMLACYSAGLAQERSQPGPPRVVLIVREDIKPGMMAAHSKHSANYASIFNRLQTPNHRIALVPVAGSENEVMYVNGGDSFAEIEKINQETDKRMATLNASMQVEMNRLDKEAPALHAGMRDILAVFRSELSYNPSVVLPTMRYIAVTTVRIRPGQEDVYADYVKNLINAARDKAKAELHIAAFQVVAGTPGTTIMFFRPMKSLAEYDLRVGPRVREAMSDDQKKKADKMAGDSVMFSETSIYAMNPGMSYVDKEFAALDPGFWNPKPQTAMKPKPKRQPTPPPPSPATQQ